MIKENTVIFGDCLNLMPQIPERMFYSNTRIFYSSSQWGLRSYLL